MAKYRVDFLATGEHKESDDLKTIKFAIKFELQLGENTPDQIIVHGIDRKKVGLK